MFVQFEHRAKRDAAAVRQAGVGIELNGLAELGRPPVRAFDHDVLGIARTVRRPPGTDAPEPGIEQLRAVDAKIAADVAPVLPLEPLVVARVAVPPPGDEEAARAL